MYDSSDSFYSFIAILLVCLFLYVAFVIPYDNKDNHKYYDVNVDLYSIDVSSQVSGNFLLGNGNVNSTMYYYSYILVSDNSYELYKFPAGSTVLHETLEPGVTAYVTEHHDLYRILDSDSIVSYDLYIPKGTIIQSYNVNVN